MKPIVTPLISRQFNTVLHSELNWEELFISGNLDKIHINCSSINKRLLHQECMHIKYITKLDGNFYSGKRYSWHGIEFSLMKHRKMIKGKPSIWKWQIQTNPCHFYSYSTFSSFIKELTRNSEHKIKRIDFSSLVKIEYFNIQFFFEAMRFGGKKTSSWYGKCILVDSNLGPKVSITCGKNPHRLTIYIRDKFGKKIKSLKNAHSINIEVQNSDEKRLEQIGIYTLNDLSKLLNTNPFKELEFYDIYRPENVSSRQKNKIVKIIEDSRIDGFHNSIKLNNKSGHFSDRHLIHFNCLKIGLEKIKLSDAIKINFKRGFRRWLED